MPRYRLKNLTSGEKLQIAWRAETSDELDYCKTLYYAARAVETYGSALRDNSFEELVAIGKRIEKEGE